MPHFKLIPLLVLGLAAPAIAQRDPILPVPIYPTLSNFYSNCTQETASGLGYTVLRPGAGRKAGDEDVVVINYIGHLPASGEVFDQAVDVPMPVSGVIPGFAEGLKLMPQGSIVRLCIPAALAYGDKGVGPIPPNSDLVFQVEILSVMSREEFEAQIRGEQAVSAD